MYEKIATILKEKGMTFSTLSKETGIAENVFSNLKARGGNLSFANAMKVSVALGVGVEELVP